MTDAFISYARKDQAFVLKVSQALKDLGKAIWIDSKDIPPTTEWLQEIFAGIEGADAFLFIISPDSIRSDFCAMELSHAVKHNKRIVTVLHREVNPDSLDPAIGPIQWIPFTAAEDFEQSLENLVDWLEVDAEWRRDHTRILVRAVEWEKKEKNKSYLLRGDDLKTAEVWLEGATTDKRKATPLQESYIVASRQADTTRRRITFGSILFAIIVAVVLGVLAINQFIRARQEVKNNTSLELAAQSDMALQSEDVTNAYHLALIAHRTSPTIESVQALYQTIAHPLPMAVLRGHMSSVYAATFNPDGTKIATASKDRTVRIWDIENGKQLARLQPALIVSHTSFSPDGSRLVATSWDSTARVMDVETGKQLANLEGHQDIVGRANFNPDGTLIVTASDDGTAKVWDAATGEERLTIYVSQLFIVNDAKFSPDGTQILTASSDGTATIWDARTGRMVQQFTGHADLVLFASFSPDGKWVVSASQDGLAAIWSVDTGETQLTLEGHTGGVTSANFNPDGTMVVTSSRDGTARVWDAASGLELAHLRGHTGIVHYASFSPDGSQIVTAGDDRLVLIHELSRYKAYPILAGHSNFVESASFSPDGARILTAGWDGTARIWNTETGEEIARLRDASNMINAASFNPAGKWIVFASREDVVVYDLETGEEAVRLEGHADMVNDASFSPDGKDIVTAGEDGTVRVWDVASGDEIARYDALPSENLQYKPSIQSAIFSSDGRHVLMGISDRTAVIWDIEENAEIAVFEGHTGEVYFADYSPDGSRVVTASWDGTARVWDIAQMIELVRFEGHNERVNSAVFSPDGTQVVTAGWDGTVRVWDVATGVELARLEGHIEQVTSARFSPDMSRIVSASWDGTARVWRWSPGGEVLVKRIEKELGALGIELGDGVLFSQEDMLGTWRIVWDKGTADEESDVLKVNQQTITAFELRVDIDGTVTFKDDENCEHSGRLSLDKTFASGEYWNCDGYPLWFGVWEAEK